MNGDGYLLTSTNPAGETTTYTYGAGGLLATRRDPGQDLTSTPMTASGA
ncbi:MAG: hypothetical protein U0232_28055 [Thermomicrobiales bacterium]